MNIIDFSKNHIEEATNLAKLNYEEERNFVNILPSIDSLPDLSEFANNNLGVVAFENTKMIGFLCCYNPCDNLFGITKGVFSPIHTHGTGIFQNLLNYTITQLKMNKFRILGVDFESFNPNAYGFWLKYFTPYIYSLTRRIDEQIINFF